MTNFTWIPVILALLSSPLKADTPGDTADYVIVGLGTAGGLLAGKLSNDKKTSVIALNQGPNLTDSFLIKYSQNMVFTVGASFLNLPPELSSIPPSLKERYNNFLKSITASSADLYERGNTVPQVDADGRSIGWVIARPGAGASSINAGAWVRMTPESMSQWEAVAGPKWSPHTLLKIYKELEHYDGKSSDQHARGHHGPIHVTQDPPPSILSEKFSKAMIQATGVPFATDFNDPHIPFSVSKQMQSAHRGPNGFYRVSAINAFLPSKHMSEDGDGRDGRKLKVHFNSFALRVIWKGKTAVGVEYLHHGKKKSVYAKKGVIVCAGLRSSPFLMHSGIGPAKLLRSLKIPVICDNPHVGKGLFDQVPAPILFASNPFDSNAGTTTFYAQIGNLPAPGDSPKGASFTSSGKISTAREAPDVATFDESIAEGAMDEEKGATDGRLAAGRKLAEEVNEAPKGRRIRMSTIDAIPGITPVAVDLLQPKSRGTITIASNNPLDEPVIDFGLFTNPEDLDLLTATFQTYVKNLNLQLQMIDPEYQLLLPPPEILDDTSLVQAYIKAIAASNFSFEGHCRMAPRKHGGVVDSRGRVYGVHHLIIADDSIIPSPMDGSTMTSAYLIAANIARLMGY